MDDDVQPPKPLVEGKSQGVEPSGFCKIHRHQRGVTSGQGEDLVVQGFQRTLGPGRSHDVGSGPGQGQGRGASDPPGGTGHQGDLVFERRVGGHAAPLARRSRGVTLRPWSFRVSLRDYCGDHELDLVEDHDRQQDQPKSVAGKQDARHGNAARQARL